jgi:hypothetical protein
VRLATKVLDAGLGLRHQEVIGERRQALVALPLEAAIVLLVVPESTSTMTLGFTSTSEVPGSTTLGPHSTVTSG